jgi:hypothetical protein
VAARHDRAMAPRAVPPAGLQIAASFCVKCARGRCKRFG